MESRAVAAPVRRRADRALARLLRDRRAARARLRVRLPAVLHEPLVGGRVLLPPVLARRVQAADRVAAGLQRPAAERPQRHRQPLDRRARGREAPDRQRAVRRRHARSRRSSSSTGTAAATSSSTSTRRRASPTPTPATTSAPTRDARKIVAWGGTTPDDEETGLGRRGVHRVWFYDLSAGPENWGGNFDVTTPTSTATASPTTGSRSRGSTAATGRSRRWRATSAR